MTAMNRGGGFDPPMRARLAKCSLWLLSSILTLLATGVSSAGPWVLSPNEFHSDIRGSYFSTETYHDAAGERPSLPGGGAFESRGIRWSNELGWKKRMSFTFDIPFESVTRQPARGA